VKLAVAGYGSAEKWQTQEMIAKLLRLSEIPKPADAADALGLALCHLAHAPNARAAIGAASIGRPLFGGTGGSGGGSGGGSSRGAPTLGGRPLKVATTVGGVRLKQAPPAGKGKAS
jgi:hypothetical protein